jgi:hypothetical protein
MKVTVCPNSAYWAYAPFRNLLEIDLILDISSESRPFSSNKNYLTHMWQYR